MGTFGTPSSYNNTGALGGATNPTTAQGLSRDRENQKAILELPGTQAWVEKTITDSVIIPTSAEIIVLPEGGASTDSLTTIALTSDGTTTLHEGMLIRLKAANSDTITVVHGTGTNNISTIDGNNVVLDTTWYLELKLINGLWVQQETHAYKTANEAKITAETAATPATTTSRGIGKVATLEDMAPDAIIENGPAFLDVKGGVVTRTPTPNAVPQADENGKVDGWVSLNGKANTDLSNITPAADGVIRSKVTFRGLGNRTTTGAWTITGVSVGRPLMIGLSTTTVNYPFYFTMRVISGAETGKTGGGTAEFGLGQTNTWLTPPTFILSPTDTTVVLQIQTAVGTGNILYAEQI